MAAEKSFLAPRKWIWIAILLFVFGLGLAIRLFDLYDAPLDFHSTRQMHSVLVARGMYYQQRSDAPDWQREMAVREWKNEPHPEPQILERLAAASYRVIGREAPWIARLYSVLFWMAGAVGLLLLGQKIVGKDGALVALIFYLFLPYGAVASRSFQPDPLMVSLLIFTLLAIVRWHEHPTWGRTVLAGLLGGMAILVKTVAAFFVAGAWIGLLFSSFNLRELLANRKVWAAAALSLLPYAGFFIYGMYIEGFLRSEFGLRFFPQLWTDPVFYLQWNSEISSVVGFAWFLTALVCTFTIHGKARGLLAGLWAGYFLYGLTFAYHISTHDYYQLPFIPLAALGLGAGAQTVFKALKGGAWLRVLLVGGVLLFFIALQSWDVIVTLKRVNYDNEIVFWQRLGETLGQDVSIVGLLQDSGARLSYWGWVEAEDWLTSGDFNVRELAGNQTDTERLFEKAVAGKDFFVVTIVQELARQPALQNLLSGYAIHEQTDDYVIYDLRQPKNQDQ